MHESTQVCVISIDPSGDTEERRSLDEFYGFDWAARCDVILVEGDMVLTYAELVEGVRRSVQATPEVIIFSPMAGGV